MWGPVWLVRLTVISAARSPAPEMTGWSVSRREQSYLSKPFGNLPQALLPVAFWNMIYFLLKDKIWSLSWNIIFVAASLKVKLNQNSINNSAASVDFGFLTCTELFPYFNKNMLIYFIIQCGLYYIHTVYYRLDNWCFFFYYIQSIKFLFVLSLFFNVCVFLRGQCTV